MKKVRRRGCAGRQRSRRARPTPPVRRRATRSRPSGRRCWSAAPATAREREGLRVDRRRAECAPRDACTGQHAVAPVEIVAAEDDRAELLLRPEHAAQRQRAFGREQVAVRPAAAPRARPRRCHSRARPRPCAAARAPASTAMSTVAGVAPGDRLHLDRRDQPGLDQRAAQVVERGRVIGVAGLEARDLRHVVGAEHAVAGQRDDPPEPPRGARRDADVERRGACVA